MNKLYTIAIAFILTAGGLTAQNASLNNNSISDYPPQVDVLIPNFEAWEGDEADSINLNNHFSDPNSPDAELTYTVILVSNETVTTASISNDTLIISYLSSGQSYVIIEATYNSLSTFDTLAVGVKPVIEGNFSLSTFDDLPLGDESYWNGSDGSGSFNSGNAILYNDYNSEYGSFTGWAFSNKSDVTTPGYMNQFSAFTGEGINTGEGSNYAISYHFSASSLAFNNSNAYEVKGLHVTNTTYAAISMKYGDDYAKKFGGEDGNDADWLKLTIEGFNNSNSTGTVDYFLADYTNSENSKDYVVETWQWIELSSLGSVDSLTFSLSSTDNGDYGMNTPSYFAIDNLYLSAFPTSTKNMTERETLTIYPNPSNGIFRIKTATNELSNIKVFDVSGNLINTIDDYSSDQQIDLSDSPSGIYIIHVTNSNYTKQQTIIIR